MTKEKKPASKEPTLHFGMRMKGAIREKLESVAQEETQKKGLRITASAIAGLLIEDGLKRYEKGALQI